MEKSRLPPSRSRAYTGPDTAGQSKIAVTTTKSLKEEIRTMKKFVLGALYALCVVSFPAAAQGTPDPGTDNGTPTAVHH